MPGQPGLPSHGDLPNPYVAAAGLHNNISPGAYRGPMVSNNLFVCPSICRSVCLFVC